jgi:aryl-alcohol dehydrogenase-like predicted oxidoreductase
MKTMFGADSLALGTVQLGTAYGIANNFGQPALEEARRIISSAYQAGIRYFDTAQAYGSSEVVLGKILTTYADVKVISKFAPDLDYLKKNMLGESFEKTIDTLGVLPFGMMLHRYEWMKDWDNGLREIIQQVVVSRGVHFGVSVYSAQEAESLMDIKEVSLIQMPFNVFYKEMVEKDIFVRAKKTKKTLFLRSVFLQGLLLIKPEEIPSEMFFAKECIEQLYSFCKKRNLEVKEFCLGYSLYKSKGFGRVLFGAETENQVLENMELVNNLNIDEKIYMDWEQILSGLNIPEQMLNPSLWPKLSKKG